jgi:bacterioferritin
MKGNPKVLKALNTSLKGELTAINQYFLHARMLENWGVTKLAAHEKKESIEEMQHADRLIQRILLLEGLPNLQDLGKLMIGQDVKETIECDMKLEIKVAEEAGDYVTRDLFLSILSDEEKHLDDQETQLDLIRQIGIQNFIQLNSDPVGAGEG